MILQRNRAEEILAILQNAVDAGRSHHAYLLSGPEGTSKESCVQTFAARQFSVPGEVSLFGGETAADPAQVLARIQSGNHPDFVWIQPLEDKISVDQIRELPRIISYAPLEAPFRLIMISRAEEMNHQAANALLKVLEEPPHHTKFFLLTENEDGLLPTIRSRCQSLRFFPVGNDEISKWARDQGVPEECISLYVGLSDGSISRLRRLLEIENFPAQTLEAGRHLVQLWKVAPKVPASAVDWIEAIEDEKFADEVPNIWLSVLRETIAGSDQVWKGLRAELAVIHERLSKEELLAHFSDKLDAIHRYRVQRKFHGNYRLDLQSLLCAMQISLGK